MCLFPFQNYFTPKLTLTVHTIFLESCNCCWSSNHYIQKDQGCGLLHTIPYFAVWYSTIGTREHRGIVGPPSAAGLGSSKTHRVDADLYFLLGDEHLAVHCVLFQSLWVAQNVPRRGGNSPRRGVLYLYEQFLVRNECSDVARYVISRLIVHTHVEKENVGFIRYCWLIDRLLFNVQLENLHMFGSVTNAGEEVT